MATSSVHPDLQLAVLPNELLLRIFEVLPSFIDALSLRATCHTLQNLWTDHRSVIVEKLVLNGFECYPLARQLLVKQQHSPSLEQRDLSDRDLSALERNVRRVEEVIVGIEQKFIPELKVEGLPEVRRSSIYGGKNEHPPTLTHTERLRVVRACYQIWLLIYCYKDDAVKAEVFSMRPRELFYFLEFAEWARVIEWPTGNRWHVFQILKSARSAMRTLYHATYGCTAPSFERRLFFEDPINIFVIWDHWQDNLRNLICSKPSSNLEWDAQEKMREDLWDFEPGDEWLLQEID